MQRGTNFTVVHKQNKRVKPIFLKSGEQIELEQGDCISFALPEYSFILSPPRYSLPLFPRTS